MIDVTKLKIDELENIKNRKYNELNEIELRIKKYKDKREKLIFLFNELLKYNKQSLWKNQELAYLENILAFDDTSYLSNDEVEYWLELLKKEIKFNKISYKYSYTYSKILSDWDENIKHSNNNFENKEYLSQVAQSFKKAVPKIDTSILESIILKGSDVFENAIKISQKKIENIFKDKVSSSELKNCIKKIIDSIYKTKNNEEILKNIFNNELLLIEYCGVLSIILRNIDKWTPSNTPKKLATIWTKNKWRVYLEEDITTLLLYEIIGHRLQLIFKTFHYDTSYQRTNNKDKFFYNENVENYNHNFKVLRKKLEYFGCNFNTAGGYESLGLAKESVFETLLLNINAEISYELAAKPEAPIYLVNLDIKDFSNSISHAAIIYLLENLNFGKEITTFLKKFLLCKVKIGKDVIDVKNGVFPNFTISNFINEIIMYMLEIYIWQKCEIKYYRIVDDIYIIEKSNTKAKEIIDNIKLFLNKINMEINIEKSSTIAINSKEKFNLFNNKFYFSALEFKNNGTFNICNKQYSILKDNLKKALDRENSVLGLVNTYNEYILFILKKLCIFSVKTKNHFIDLKNKINDLHTNLYSENFGIEEKISRMIHDKLNLDIPVCCYYWPKTAGGLGLYNPKITINMITDSVKLSDKIKVPKIKNFKMENYLNNKNLSDYFEDLNESIKVSEPDGNTKLQGLINEFSIRGSEVKANYRNTYSSNDISDYWKWVILFYSEELLNNFGSFRFIDTEYIPLYMIVENSLGTSNDD